jgi:hypothetical protein
LNKRWEEKKKEKKKKREKEVEEWGRLRIDLGRMDLGCQFPDRISSGRTRPASSQGKDPRRGYLGKVPSAGAYPGGFSSR